MKYHLKDSHPIQYAAAQMITGLHERADKENIRKKLILVEENVHQMLEQFEQVDSDTIDHF